MRNSGVHPGSVDGATNLARLEMRAHGIHDHARLPGDRAGRRRCAGQGPLYFSTRHELRFGLGPVRQQHARHVPATHFVGMLFAPLSHQVPRVVAADCNSGFTQGQEEDVIRRGDYAPGGEFGADRRKLRRSDATMK